MNDLKERIIKLRKLFRLTQSEFAQKIFVSDKVVSKWECGESMPSVENIKAISEFFKVSTDYFLTGKASEQDKLILNRKPTAEELFIDAKENWIKQCNCIMKNSSLYSYKDRIFPTEEIDNYLASTEFVKFQDVGIFHQIGNLPDMNLGIQLFGLGINLKKLLALNDYDLFIKMVNTNLPLYSYEDTVRNFYKFNEFLTYDDIAGLTDIRFYELLANQEILMKNSLLQKGYTIEQYKKDNSDISSYIKEILNEALRKIDKSHPRYWEIVKLLIEKDASIQKLVKVVYKSPDCGWGDSPLEMVYADDVFLTDCIYELALIKISK